MRKVYLFIWFLLPIAWACYYYGPGQDYLKKDNAAELMQQARVEEKNGAWLKARALYDDALNELPEKNADEERVTLRLAKSRTFLNTGDVVKATEEAEVLMEEVQNGKLKVNSKFKDDVRASLAHAEYYTAWHMRLEGSPRAKWMKELETSRQNFRLLAEVEKTKNLKVNLEAVVMLARMDLNKLKTVPLPDKDSGKDSCGV
jgi:hypothetical protein